MHYPQPEGVSLVRTSLLRKIVKSSFLPRLPAKGKEFCKLGRDLEIPFARKLLQQSKEGLTMFEVQKIYLVGLVGKKNHLYAKVSCDFIAGVVAEGENLLVGVECKARLTPSTDQQERLHSEFLSHFYNLSLANSTSRTTGRHPLVSVRSVFYVVGTISWYTST